MTAATTLDLVQRLYACLDERDPYAPMLAVLLSAFGARQGFVAVAARGDDGLVLGAQQGLAPLDAATLQPIWAQLLDGPAFRIGADLPADLRGVLPLEGDVAVVIARHQELGESLWVVARARPFDAEARVRGAVIAANLDHAGRVALARGRAPKGSQNRTSTGDLGPLVRPLQQQPGDARARRVSELVPRAGQTARPAPARTGQSRRYVPQGLTARAWRCARLAARGRTDDEIAQALGISATTVSRDLQAAYRAFGVRGRHELDIAALVGEDDPE